MKNILLTAITLIGLSASALEGTWKSEYQHRLGGSIFVELEANTLTFTINATNCRTEVDLPIRFEYGGSIIRILKGGTWGLASGSTHCPLDIPDNVMIGVSIDKQILALPMDIVPTADPQRYILLKKIE